MFAVRQKNARVTIAHFRQMTIAPYMDVGRGLRGAECVGSFSRTVGEKPKRRVKMTDRVCALTVYLDRDIRVDDIEPLINAIEQLRGVGEVQKHISNQIGIDTVVWRERMRIAGGISKVIWRHNHD